LSTMLIVSWAVIFPLLYFITAFDFTVISLQCVDVYSSEALGKDPLRLPSEPQRQL
jgi:hypothetical protein